MLLYPVIRSSPVSFDVNDAMCRWVLDVERLLVVLLQELHRMGFWIAPDDIIAKFGELKDIISRAFSNARYACLVGRYSMH